MIDIWSSTDTILTICAPDLPIALDPLGELLFRLRI